MTNQNRSPEIDFLIEEYKNIAATHDEVRHLVVRLFNYFLLLSAFPFTVAGIVFRKDGFNLSSVPREVYFLFLVAGFGNLLLTVALVDARMGQYRYARAVNLIRKFFEDTFSGLSKYLYLPTDPQRPSWAWTSLGFVAYQIVFMLLVGGIFIFYGVHGIAGLTLAIVAVVVYVLLYVVVHLLTLRRYEKYIGIK